jgi:hypothetical protein
MMPESPAKGGTSVTPAPVQTNLISDAETTISVHGSLEVPAPWYLYPAPEAPWPFPWDLPRRRQPAAGRSMIIDGELPPVSTILSSPPSSVGSPVGRLNEDPFADILARVPACTRCISPGISTSAARADCAVTTVTRHQSPRPLLINERICGSSLSTSTTACSEGGAKFNLRSASDIAIP